MNNQKSFALEADKNDPLASYKDQFYFPQHNGKNAIYFCGNSLGLQPKKLAASIQTELDTWKEIAVGLFWRKKPLALLSRPM